MQLNKVNKTKPPKARQYNPHLSNSATLFIQDICIKQVIFLPV